jgi:hypothetical protein
LDAERQRKQERRDYEKNQRERALDDRVVSRPTPAWLKEQNRARAEEKAGG